MNVSGLRPLGDTILPADAAERSDWVVARRGDRRRVDPAVPYASGCEPERTGRGGIADVVTLFLTNRECPWRCVMCDLWRDTLPHPLAPGILPAQIAAGLARHPEPARGAQRRHLKLYNAGSFFDHGAIPPADHAAIARLASGFDRTIVECHPRLVGESAVRFRDALHRAAEPGRTPDLELALGLETIHPVVLDRLNKRFTLDDFVASAAFLRRHGIALRVFLLVQPPWLDAAEAVHWAVRSARFAFDHGAEVVSLIPVRPGNGALDELAARREFVPPRLATLERALDEVLVLPRDAPVQRAFADTWDLGQFSDCAACLPRRTARLQRINLSQAAEPPISCPHCRDGGPVRSV